MKKNNLRRLRANVDQAQFPANLTTCERNVLEAMADCGYRKTAAEKLCISCGTLGDHLKSAAIKSGSRNTLQMVARYLLATEERAS